MNPNLRPFVHWNITQLCVAPFILSVCSLSGCFFTGVPILGCTYMSVWPLSFPVLFPSSLSLFFKIKKYICVMMFALLRLLCINWNSYEKNCCMYWNSKLCCRCILLSNPCFKNWKKKKKKHIIHAAIWVSWAGAGWGGDYPRFWILNCNIENRLFSVIIDLSILYRFFSLFVLNCFLILLLMVQPLPSVAVC